jgi:hypothetical protein
MELSLCVAPERRQQRKPMQGPVLMAFVEGVEAKEKNGGASMPLQPAEPETLDRLPLRLVRGLSPPCAAHEPHHQS